MKECGEGGGAVVGGEEKEVPLGTGFEIDSAGRVVVLL